MKTPLRLIALVLVLCFAGEQIVLAAPESFSRSTLNPIRSLKNRTDLTSEFRISGPEVLAALTPWKGARLSQASNQSQANPQDPKKKKDWALIALAAVDLILLGFLGVRVEVFLGTLSAILVYKISETLSKNFVRTGYKNYVPLYSFILFALSTPVIHISTLGAYDIMSLTLFLSGFHLLSKGIQKEKLVLAASSIPVFLLTFSTSYEALLLIPILVAYIASELFQPEKLIEDHFLKTSEEVPLSKDIAVEFLVLFSGVFTLYYALNSSLILPAIQHSSQLAGSDVTAVNKSMMDIAVKTAYFSPVIIAAVAAFVAYSLGIFGMKNQSKKRWLTSQKQWLTATFLVLASSWIPAYHAYQHNSFAMEKKLASSVVFGALLSAIAIQKIQQWLSKPYNNQGGSWLTAFVLGVLLLWSEPAKVQSLRKKEEIPPAVPVSPSTLEGALGQPASDVTPSQTSPARLAVWSQGKTRIVTMQNFLNPLRPSQNKLLTQIGKIKVSPAVSV